MNVKLQIHEFSSGTGFVIPSLTFKVSKIIEASKRFGRGYKPRPASSTEFATSGAWFATSGTEFLTSGTGLATPSQTF